MTTLSKHDDGVWIIDGVGATVFTSQRMAEILESTQTELIGRDSFAFIFPEDQAEAQRRFDGKKRGDIDPFEFRLRTAKGRAVCVRIQATPIHDKAGAFQGVVGNFTLLAGH